MNEKLRIAEGWYTGMHANAVTGLTLSIETLLVKENVKECTCHIFINPHKLAYCHPTTLIIVLMKYTN